MATALVGYTGYVGTTLLSQIEFDELYNSKNISDLAGKKFDSLICAGAPAVKWKANQQPEEDLANLQILMSSLEKVEVKKFILISTVDVYATPFRVDENKQINPQESDAYGRNRYILEQFVMNHFSDYLIIRLPGLFGKGLKKNFIYDMIHTNCLHLSHYESVFQFYDMSRLWKDIQVAIEKDLKIVNFATEPVSVAEIAKVCFGETFTNVTEKNPVHYDMRSVYASYFGKQGDYLVTKVEVLDQISQFVKAEKGEL